MKEGKEVDVGVKLLGKSISYTRDYSRFYLYLLRLWKERELHF
jgi:hypothetical protein